MSSPVLERVDVRTLDAPAFHARYKDPSVPVVLTHAMDPRDWDLTSFVDLLDASTEVDARCYGRGHLARPERWNIDGYCPSQVPLRADAFAEMVRSGRAQDKDIYVVGDISKTQAGSIMAPQFDALAARLGLRLSNFGPVITAWWGAPGHTEPLHVDVVDGTLWQLYGHKRVWLLPPEDWEAACPFELGGKMSWAFSQTSIRHPDPARFPQLAEAMPRVIVVDLAPGEILFIPVGWAHEVSGLEGSQHVLSLNRFWWTPMDKLSFLPEAVLQEIVPEPGRGKLLAHKRDGRDSRDSRDSRESRDNTAHALHASPAQK